MGEEETSHKHQKLQKERDEYLAGWKRTTADFVNYKKEVAVKIERIGDAAKEEQILVCLPIIDDLERAASEVTAAEKKDPVVQGFLKITERFKTILKKQGIEEIETKGAAFDPALHEAVAEVKGEKPGVIVEELARGYTRKGKLLRAAKVKVGV